MKWREREGANLERERDRKKGEIKRYIEEERKHNLEKERGKKHDEKGCDKGKIENITRTG